VLGVSALLSLAPIHWPLEDFAEYWAAGRLNASGRNPYDGALMLTEERQLGWTASRPVMMYNPPWTLGVAMPLGAMPFPIARSIWMVTQLVLTCWSASQLWSLYGGEPRRRLAACWIALLWMPTLVALRMGQTSTFMLFGLVGFLSALAAGKEFRAGVLLSLAALKPQLIALAWVPLLLWAFRERRWRPVAGVLVALALGTVAAVAANPSVLGQYSHLMTLAPPTLEFESPSVAGLLRGVAGGSIWPQYLPVCAGTLLVAVVWFRHREQWIWLRHMPGLVLASCLVTPYGGWAFDLVVLLIPILSTAVVVQAQATRGRLWMSATAFLAVSLVALAMHVAGAPQSAFIWMTPAVAVLTVAARIPSSPPSTAAAASRST
jgi:Glycosyltransferase family 87